MSLSFNISPAVFQGSQADAKKFASSCLEVDIQPVPGETYPEDFIFTPREMVEWSVFYKLEYEAQERAYREASSKSRSRSR